MILFIKKFREGEAFEFKKKITKIFVKIFGEFPQSCGEWEIFEIMKNFWHWQRTIFYSGFKLKISKVQSFTFFSPKKFNN